MNSPLMAVRRL